MIRVECVPVCKYQICLIANLVWKTPIKTYAIMHLINEIIIILVHYFN